MTNQEIVARFEADSATIFKTINAAFQRGGRAENIKKSLFEFGWKCTETDQELSTYPTFVVGFDKDNVKCAFALESEQDEQWEKVKKMYATSEDEVVFVRVIFDELWKRKFDLLSSPMKAGEYRHFKGNLYYVQGEAKHIDLGEMYVLYVAMEGHYGPPHLRKKKDFFDIVTTEDGAQHLRFEYIEPSKIEIHSIHEYEFIEPVDCIADLRQPLNTEHKYACYIKEDYFGGIRMAFWNPALKKWDICQVAQRPAGYGLSPAYPAEFPATLTHNMLLTGPIPS